METVTYRRQRVFDPLLRLLHWFNALAIVLLFATELGAEALEKGPMPAPSATTPGPAWPTWGFTRY